jgi:hypothetical protein
MMNRPKNCSMLSVKPSASSTTRPVPRKLMSTGSDAKTAMIHTHVLNRGGLAVRGPLD